MSEALKIKYLQTKLKEIANILSLSLDKFENPGVLAGISGLALFMYNYSRYSGDNKYYRIGEKALNKAVNMVNDGYKLHSFCSGISGLGWTYDHLARHKLIARDSISFFKDIEPYLLSCMESDFNLNNYDFLHGGMGVGYYFITSQNTNHKAICVLLDCLERTANKMEDGSLKWGSFLSGDSRDIGYNISLSHGMSSIIMCMVKLIQLHPVFIERAKIILSGAVSYIVKQKNIQTDYSYFPTHSLESDERFTSRLGWCYGDLGIAQALLQASFVLHDISLMQFANRVLFHNCQRRNLKDNAIFDAGICHGTIGISHMFQTFFRNNPNGLFQKTADYWLDQTIEMAKFDEGVAGFKKLRGSEWIDSYFLLEGVTGIACCLMSYLDEDYSKWNECILLS